MFHSITTDLLQHVWHKVTIPNFQSLCLLVLKMKLIHYLFQELKPHIFKVNKKQKTFTVYSEASVTLLVRIRTYRCVYFVGVSPSYAPYLCIFMYRYKLCSCFAQHSIDFSRPGSMPQNARRHPLFARSYPNFQTRSRASLSKTLSPSFERIQLAHNQNGSRDCWVEFVLLLFGYRERGWISFFLNFFFFSCNIFSSLY